MRNRDVLVLNKLVNELLELCEKQVPIRANTNIEKVKLAKNEVLIKLSVNLKMYQKSKNSIFRPLADKDYLESVKKTVSNAYRDYRKIETSHLLFIQSPTCSKLEGYKKQLIQLSQVVRASSAYQPSQLQLHIQLSDPEQLNGCVACNLF